jgi:transposase InsO family protein
LTAKVRLEPHRPPLGFDWQKPTAHEPSEQLPRQCSVAESFFNLPERERIRRRVYKTCTDAQQDVFDYLEMFYNPKRKHVRNGMLSRVEFERQQAMRTERV